MEFCRPKQIMCKQYCSIQDECQMPISCIAGVRPMVVHISKMQEERDNCKQDAEELQKAVKFWKEEAKGRLAEIEELKEALEKVKESRYGWMHKIGRLQDVIEEYGEAIERYEANIRGKQATIKDLREENRQIKKKFEKEIDWEGKIKALEGAKDYWQEEAKRYATNSEYWQDRAETAEADRATKEATK